jgi:hypothetical protein
LDRIVEDVFKKGKYLKTKDYLETDSKKRLKREKFKKCFNDFLIVLSKLKGSEPLVLSVILLNINNHNLFITTYSKLSNMCMLSEIRVKQIMSKLQKLNIVKNINGHIYVNPFMYVKDGSKEQELQLEYFEIFKQGEENEN